jgi:perosamine synthetase
MIHLSEPAFLGREIEYVTDALSRRALSHGDYVERFERAFAEACDVRHAIAVDHGTSALFAALLALDVRPGDEVIVPALTYAATAFAVTMCGATPVIVDVYPETWTINWRAVANAITPRTVAIIPVHLYGVPAIGPQRSFLDIPVLEDAAEAHGAMVRGFPVGSLGTAGAFSFYGNKILTTGEGGVVTTNDDRIADRVRVLRRQGMSLTRRYYHPDVGYNLRMTNLQGALGLAQVETWAEHLELRRALYARYLAALGPSQIAPPDAAPWVFPVLVEDRDRVVAGMEAAGIETRPVFVPLNEQPVFAGGRPDPCPVAERLSREGLLLPLHAGLSFADVDRVCEVIP